MIIEGGPELRGLLMLIPHQRTYCSPLFTLSLLLPSSEVESDISWKPSPLKRGQRPTFSNFLKTVILGSGDLRQVDEWYWSTKFRILWYILPRYSRMKGLSNLAVLTAAARRLQVARWPGTLRPTCSQCSVVSIEHRSIAHNTEGTSWRSWVSLP